MGKTYILTEFCIIAVLFYGSRFSSCNVQLRTKSFSGQVVLQPVSAPDASPTVQPGVEYVTPSAPLSDSEGEEVSSPSAGQPAAANVTLKYEEIGLQYTDTAYVSVILATVIPASVLFLYFTFAGAAPAVSGIFAAISTGIMSFYIILALFINLDTPPSIGISVSSPILAAVFVTSMFFPEGLGWTATIFIMNLLAITLISNLICAFIGEGYGILHIIPGFENETATIQYLSYYFTLLLLSTLVLAWQYFNSPKHNIPPNVSRNFVSAFVSSYVVVSAISYITVISGLSLSSPLDPIGFFEIPTLFDYKVFFNYVLLVLWLGLTYAGYIVQDIRASGSGEYE